MRYVLALSAILMLAFFVGTKSQAAEKWDMPTAYAATNYHTENIVRFAEAVREATNGSIEIVVHPGGSLFKGNEIKRAVQTGQAQLGERILSAHVAENALFMVPELPFLATTFEDAWHMYQASKPVIEEILLDQNLKPLFSVPWPPQGLLSTIPVNSLADLKGVKMRAHSAAVAQMIEQLGAQPVQVEAAELSQAYATNLVQAHFTSGATPWHSKLYELVDYYYDFGAWVPWNTVFINLEVWNGLDEQTQGVILGAANMAERVGWAKAEELTKWYAEQLASKGMNVQAPSDELLSQLNDVGEAILKDWLATTGDAGKKIIESYQKM